MINHECTKRLYHNDLPKHKERFNNTSSSVRINKNSQNSKNNFNSTFSNLPTNSNNIIKTEENLYSTFYKEMEKKSEFETNYLGKNPEELKQYKFNYFLSKKPNTSHSTARVNFKRPVINDDYNFNSEAHNHNPLLSNKVRVDSLIELGSQNNRKLNENYNLIKREEPISPWNGHVKKNSQANNTQNFINNTNQMNYSNNDYLNNRQEVEGQKADNRYISNTILPNVNNYACITRPDKPKKLLKLKINENPAQINEENLNAIKNTKNAFRPSATNSAFFKASPHNQNIKSPKQSDIKKSNCNKDGYVLLNEYFDGINKSIYNEKASSTKNKSKITFHGLNRVKLRDAFKSDVNSKQSLEIIDNYLKRKEIFG